MRFARALIVLHLAMVWHWQDYGRKFFKWISNLTVLECLCSECVSVCMPVSLLWVALPPSTDSEDRVVTERDSVPRYSVSGLLNYPAQTQDMSSRAYTVYCSLKSACRAVTLATMSAWVFFSPFWAGMMTCSTAFVGTCFVLWPFTFHAKAVSSSHAGLNEAEQHECT